MEDLQPLPLQVTPENARLVVRRCLQAKRSSTKEIGRRSGYAFWPDGFVQITHDSRLVDQGNERVTRLYVAYQSVAGTQVETYFDVSLLRERVRMTIRGRLRRWDSVLTPYRSQPGLREEPATVNIDSMDLDFDDPNLAQKLDEALRTLVRR